MKLIAYADDLIVSPRPQMQFSSKSLELAEQKTEVLLISTRKVEERIVLTIGSARILDSHN